MSFKGNKHKEVFLIYIKTLSNEIKNLNNDIFNILNEYIPRKISHKDLDYFAIGSKRSAYNPPKNNDGRDVCWWCGKRTKIIQGFCSQYNVCEDCKK